MIDISIFQLEAVKAISVEAAASSSVYRFIVGPEKKEYHIHSAVLANHSSALDAMVNDGLQESGEKIVDWTDVDSGAFLGLWHFLYSGRYAAPVLISRLGEDHPATKIREEEAGTLPDRTLPICTLPGCKRPGCKMPGCTIPAGLWLDFQTLRLADLEESPPPQPKSVGRRVVVNSYTDLLLQHARVCVLADKYMIPPLKQLALTALQKELGIHLYDLETISEIAPDAIALLQFSFNNPAPDKLRELVTLFAACIITDLWECEGFQDLMGSSEEFSAAVSGCIGTNLDGRLLKRLLDH
ncbi:unnamed protein product [Clonostachys byssicola]|uniref:BTB domain-containing protein n=1 Tax=Clonostachys byssicola TaxID=160290 RepID=A0A9N9U0P0_9HYPO|nr:unnamed protein product [Clonostachys byssicola]